MSMPLGQQQGPLVNVNPQSFAGIHSSSHPSVGPVIAVLVVIMILGIAAVMIGRMCSGRRILGYGQYDIEGWAETKCSTCIDGRITPSPPPLPRPPTPPATTAPPPPLGDSDNAASHGDNDDEEDESGGSSSPT